MLSILKGLVGSQRASDGDERAIRLGNHGEVVTNSGVGSFYDQISRGNGYAFATAIAGAEFPAAGASANVPAIWNPPGSGRVLSIIKVVIARTAVGTPLEAAICYQRLQAVNSRKGTAADLVSGTAVAAVNLRSDLGDASGMVFFPTTMVTTTTPTLWATAFAQTADDGATTVSGPRTEVICDHVDGLLLVYPGTLFSMSASAATNTTYQTTIFGLSLPLPNTN